VQLGVLVEVEDGLTWAQWRSVAATVEGLGFESLWLSDHFLTRDGDDRGGIEAWTALAVAAAETRHLRLGPLVSPVTFRAPGVLARMARSLADLTQGRFELGLGAGWNEHEHARYGVPFPPARDRSDLLDLGAAQVRSLVEPRQVPLVIGGAGDRTLRTAARWADEWNMTTNQPDVVRARGARLDEYCTALGRDPATLRRSVAVGLLIGHDEMELAHRSRALQALVPDLAGLAASEVPSAARASGWLVGTPNEIVHQLKALDAAGVDRAILGHYDHADTEALALIAREVIPSLHGAS
jgi:alkanesulfonate monooxygenase SsuD/methylene tetrahydromethanopterin reductase-like flavin-dependent oxidoreductase (luciferase family)